MDVPTFLAVESSLTESMGFAQDEGSSLLKGDVWNNLLL